MMINEKQTYNKETNNNDYNNRNKIVAATVGHTVLVIMWQQLVFDAYKKRL